ncbi:integrator complex subunit 12 [Drosophila guanche]|uniref:Integrator complex subunit 12 n=1 Tax=Drosophila guanche TaxID=7266 RepID=A0A3B0JJY4_DROGU|nr:integrator complex subunit 12 [Drosophila guanche]SPP81103.1 blast:Integrator complex subunit 12 [Drosophila guanche]
MAANIAAAVAVPQEVDPVLKKAIKLLHSSNSTSAAELRLLLDEALRARYGSEKSVTNNMTQRMMDDEMSFPGRAPTPPQPINTDEIINLTNSPDKDPSDSVDTIIDSDECLSAAGIVNTGDTGDFGDLNCCVCGEMMFTATNRLVECSKCGAMYHQECHKPPITKEDAADDQEQTWQCDTCCNKPTGSRTTAPAAAATSTLPPSIFIADDPMPLAASKASKTASGASSRSSTSSNSSSPFYRPEPSSSTNASSSSSSKQGHKSSSSSSSKSHKEERASKSVAPALAAISGVEKHTSGPTSSTSRRSSSNTKSSKSSSSSKHHESSSSGGSKRRSKQ